MILTEPKLKNKIVFYILGFVIISLFIVTVLGLDDMVNKKDGHPIVKLFHSLQNYDLKSIIAGFIVFGFLGWCGIGTFILITLGTFLILSKLDSNLKQIKWTESNYLSQDISNWMNVSLSTFFITVLSAMVGLIVMSFIYAYRY